MTPCGVIAGSSGIVRPGFKIVNNRVIEIPITEDQIMRAEAREGGMEASILARFGRTYLNDSISAGYGTFGGLLGEEVIYDFFQQYWVRSQGGEIFDWDFRDRLLGRIDVKTKIQGYAEPPRMHYNATVCNANTHQLCDWYCFVRVSTDATRAWLLGFLPKKYFFDIATFGKKGETDPTSHNGWTFKWDCWNVPVSHTFVPPTTAAGFVDLMRQARAKEDLA